MTSLFETERVRLTSITDDDLPQFAIWLSDIGLQRLLNPGMSMPHDKEDFLNPDGWFQADLQSEKSRIFAIRDRNDNTFIGISAFSGLNMVTHCAEIGINLAHPGYRGKGYGTEVMLITMRYGFQQFNLNKISLLVMGFNTRAIRLYEKIGFQHEARLRESCFRDGKLFDNLMMGILRALNGRQNMDNFDIRGDEIRQGQQVYLDAVSQESVDSFKDEQLPEKMLYQLNDGKVAIRPQSAKKFAEAVKNGEDIKFALRLKETNHCIGFISLDDVAWQARTAKLSITILDEAHFTVETVQDTIQTILQFAYWEANLNRISLHCLEDNSILEEALESTGFSQEGKLRQEAYRDGQYLDILVYSILAKDWSA